MTSTLEKDITIDGKSISDDIESVVVCGSRDWTDRDYMEIQMLSWLPDNPLVIVGRGGNADLFAEDIALKHGWQIKAFEAEWKRYGRAAGPTRNSRMLDENPDLVMAFQIGNSRGTQDTIDKAIARGIPVIIFSRRVPRGLTKIIIES